MQQDLFSSQQMEDVGQIAPLFDVDKYQKITLSSKVRQDEYTKYIEDNFDLHVSDTCVVEIPDKLNLDHLHKDWNIGVICGASGSGKSTILKHLCKKNKWE